MSKLSLGKLWMIAYRDLGRNRRRSILTLVAVALGMGLLIVMSGLVAGAVAGSIENSIRLQTGDLQVRAKSYDEEELSLKWEDLLENPEGLAAKIRTIGTVRLATPVLWANGLLVVGDESVGVQVFGIDPISQAYAPIREALVAGKFITPDDREGIVIGKRLAESLGLTVGQRLNLVIDTSDQQTDEATFAIRGLFYTGVPSYDETRVFVPLPKAQAFTRTEGHASSIFILLGRKEQADSVAQSLRAPQFTVLTWQDLNQVLLQTLQASSIFLNMMNLVVLAVVAIVIANTLLMAVFERTREIGILAAVGMKGRQILAMFVLEAATLGLAGIALGTVLGGMGVAYLATVGLPIGEAAAAGEASNVITYGNILYARFSLPDTISLSIASLAITLLASLYPAWFAARLEPIDALRAV
jgi:ABC-type lipoprotein release transport system permease subunit